MQSNSNSAVAILIPTRNRSGFVERLVKYYASVKSPHTLYIGDASESFHIEQTKKIVSRYSHDISVVHFSWPGLSAHETMIGLAEESRESYCAFVGDDDFLVSDSLTKCAIFLDSNPSFRTAQGKALIFSLMRLK